MLTLLAFKSIDLPIGLRVTPKEEESGMVISEYQLISSYTDFKLPESKPALKAPEV